MGSSSGARAGGRRCTIRGCSRDAVGRIVVGQAAVTKPCLGHLVAMAARMCLDTTLHHPVPPVAELEISMVMMILETFTDLGYIDKAEPG